MNSLSALRTSNRGNRRRFSAGALVPLTALFVSGLLVGGALGCSDPLGPDLGELERARARWEEHAPVLYEYRLQRSCFCPRSFVRPVRITVSDGVVVAAVDPGTNEPLNPPPDGFPTIDDLFDEIQDAIDREADSVDATYDGALGYPVQVFIDWIENAIDDEMAFQVSEYVGALPALEVDPRTR
jgi:hypothetical protein